MSRSATVCFICLVEGPELAGPFLRSKWFTSEAEALEYAERMPGVIGIEKNYSEITRVRSCSGAQFTPPGLPLVKAFQP